MHRPISNSQPAQAEYLTLFSRSICPENIKMCYFVFLKILINKYSKLLIFLDDLNDDFNLTRMRYAGNPNYLMLF